MVQSYPTLGDLWPYSEAAVPPELAPLPVDIFFGDPKGSSLSAAAWTRVADPEAAPRASYALRLTRAGGLAELSVWEPVSGTWTPVRGFEVPDGPDAASVIELNGIVLGGVADKDQLEARLKLLLQSEISEMKALRFLSKILGILSVIVLFFAVRAGVETHAPEPFALIFALAFGIGLTSVGLRNRCRMLGENGLVRLREQFQFEFRPAEHKGLSAADMARILRDTDRQREEEAAIFGFLLLLCFVYFISALVVVGVIVALVIVTLMTRDPNAPRILLVARERAETRLEGAFLSLRASDDTLSPPELRHAKKEILRDRLRRHGAISEKLREKSASMRLTQDLASAAAFFVIFAAYAFPIAAGFKPLAATTWDSLIQTSLFSVAPVIILISISKNTVALAGIVNRRLAGVGA